jgi:hypothetical protein
LDDGGAGGASDGGRDGGGASDGGRDGGGAGEHVADAEAGGHGGAAGGVVLDPDNLLSDFEDPAAATIVAAGTPARHGFWYSFNDMTASCTQVPAAGAAYVGEAPPTSSPGPSGGLALHAVWNMCSASGAGVGADINQPFVDGGGRYFGPKVPYDLTGYAGITFFAMAAPGSDTKLRVKLPMIDETAIADGGKCSDAVAGKCGDDYGFAFTLPASGAWTQITARFADTATFRQQGFGRVFAWMPSDVTSIEIQSQEIGELYDFWIDDMYLYR